MENIQALSFKSIIHPIERHAILVACEVGLLGRRDLSICRDFPKVLLCIVPRSSGYSIGIAG